MPAPKLKDGQKDGRASNSRPLKSSEKRDITISARVSKTVATWIRKQPRGWLPNLLEKLAFNEK